MATYRTAYRYHFKLGNKIVHTGITNDPDRREFELQYEPGWEKGHIIEVGRRTFLETAEAWLQEQGEKGKPIEDRPPAEAAVKFLKEVSSYRYDQPQPAA